MPAHDDKEDSVNTTLDDDRMTATEARKALGYKANKTIYRLADPQDPRWGGSPPLSPGVKRPGGRDLWFLRREVEEYRRSGTPRARGTN